MFDFLRRKPNATAEMVADALFNVLIESEESNAQWAATFRDLEVDPDSGLCELLYLRAVALDIAVITGLRASPRRDEVLDGYPARLERLLGERYSTEDFQARKGIYLESFERAVRAGPGKLSEGKANPYWEIALKFAEFLGSKDIALVTIGANFAQYLNKAHEFLKSVKIA
jgi:hypothetical protein